MIIDMPDTTTANIAKRLVSVREEGGAVALGRVLTLVIVADAGRDEDAIAAANVASAEHPMRVIVLERAVASGDAGTGAHSDSPARLDAEIRVGGDAGASEVILLRPTGDAANDPRTLVEGLLLPDAPVVTWWAGDVVERPSAQPLGHIAQLRITDARNSPARTSLATLAEGFEAGDTDLSWTRLSPWRAVLASVLDVPPFERITSATVRGRDCAPVLLMASWLALSLDVEARICEESIPDEVHTGLLAVELERASGTVSLHRTSDTTVELQQPGVLPQVVALPLRHLPEVLAEELRSLAPDRFLGRVLREGLPQITRQERGEAMTQTALGGQSASVAAAVPGETSAGASS